MGILRIRRISNNRLLLKINILNGHRQADRQPSTTEFPYGLIENIRITWICTMIDWTIGGRLHQKPCAREVIHTSIIPALGGWTLEFPWDQT